MTPFSADEQILRKLNIIKPASILCLDKISLIELVVKGFK